LRLKEEGYKTVNHIIHYVDFNSKDIYLITFPIYTTVQICITKPRRTKTANGYQSNLFDDSDETKQTAPNSNLILFNTADNMVNKTDISTINVCAIS